VSLYFYIRRRFLFSSHPGVLFVSPPKRPYFGGPKNFWGGPQFAPPNAPGFLSGIHNYWGELLHLEKEGGPSKTHRGLSNTPKPQDLMTLKGGKISLQNSIEPAPNLPLFGAPFKGFPNLPL